MSPNHLSLLWPSVATVLGDITSSLIATVTIRQQRRATVDVTRARCYSGPQQRWLFKWYHLGSLLLSVTIATSRLVPPHSQKVRLAYISTYLHQVHWGGDSHGYTKQISSVSMGNILFFFMQLSKRETCLLISPTSLTELGRSHVKKFHTNVCYVQHLRESSPHQPGYHGLANWFHITIEPDANREYSWHVRSISPWFIFLNDIYYFDR
jgi:hypothetical protein